MQKEEEEKKRVNTNVYHMNDSISSIYIYVYKHEYITELTVCARVCLFSVIGKEEVRLNYIKYI